MLPLGLDEDASTQEVLDHYGIPVDAEEFERIVDEATTVVDVQLATRSARTDVKPVLTILDLLDELQAPHRELINEERGR